MKMSALYNYMYITIISNIYIITIIISNVTIELCGLEGYTY